MNLYAQFARLVPAAPLLYGTILSVADGVAAVEVIGGGRISARGGEGYAAGQAVWVRNGLIEGQAPAMATHVIEV